MNIIFDIDGGLFCFYKEFPRSPNSETIIWRFGSSTDLDLVFMDYILIRFCITLFVVHIPPEGFEERVNELQAYLGLVILPRSVILEIKTEAFNQIDDFFWCRHISFQNISLI
jgi:hypothetical protein